VVYRIRRDIQHFGRSRFYSRKYLQRAGTADVGFVANDNHPAPSDTGRETNRRFSRIVCLNDVLDVARRARVLTYDLLQNWQSVLAYVGIVLIAALFNTVLALLCSTLFRKTSVAIMMSYMGLVALYLLPMAIYYLTLNFNQSPISSEMARWLGVASPFMALRFVPFYVQTDGTNVAVQTWELVGAYFSVTFGLIVMSLGMITFFLNDRARLSGRS
jgi:hypothetical protein